MRDRETTFLRVVERLTGGEAPLGRLLAFAPAAVAVGMHDSTIAAIFRGEPERVDELRERLRELVEGNSDVNLKLVVIGGGEEQREALAAAQPRLLFRRTVQIFHLGDDGEPWVGRATRASSPMARLLAEVCASDGPVPRREELLARVEQPSAQQLETIAEHQGFAERFRERKPWATRALGGAIAIAFALELAWGGSELVPTLVRMGANTAAALDDEPWRLGSSALLHAGFAHVLVNLWVLVALGGLVERVIGGSRLLVLYVLAAVGGSLASAISAKAVLSVGASGAIWGLLGASAALALRPGGALPAALVPGLRRNALVNLLINLSVSFLPEVDLMAHLGGGVVGLALVGSGVLTRGIDHRVGPRARALVPVAIAAAIALHAAFVLACLHGRPWQIVDAPSFRAHDIPGSRLSIEVPTMLAEPRAPMAGGDAALELGDVLFDPMAVVVTVVPGEPMPEGGEPTSAQDEQSFDNGLRQLVRVEHHPHELVRIDVFWWDDAPEAWAQAAERVATSVRER